MFDNGASAVVFFGKPNAVRNPLFEYHQRQSDTDIDENPRPQADNYLVDCTVEDCLQRRFGVVEKQATGVQISLSMGITIRHGSISEASPAGINISEGIFGGHLIEFCDVFNTVGETVDLLLSCSTAIVHPLNTGTIFVGAIVATGETGSQPQAPSRRKWR